jgi:glycosyltransferase involved in cell wall biosynthesis
MKILMAEYQPWQHRVEDGEHKYARFFLQDNHKVFWLAHYLDLRRMLRRREDDVAFYKLWRKGVDSPETDLLTFTPLSFVPYLRFPGFDNRIVAQNCLKYTIPNVREIVKKQNFGHVDLLWIGDPRLYSLVDLVDFDRLVYRMSDDMESFPTGPRSIGEIEATICKRADLVFATARRLVEKTQRFTANVCYLPNGADFHLFHIPTPPLPTDLANIPEPRIIFVGVIGDWFDFESILHAAEALPQYNFVIIGPGEGKERVQAGLASLRCMSNIHVMGSRPFAQVPAYLAHSHIGLIPFIKNKLTDAINPIKLFEYAAAGLPVVCRNLEEVQNLASPALLYNSHQEFIEHIETAIKSREALRPICVEFGRTNSWRSRYEVVKSELMKLS